MKINVGETIPGLVDNGNTVKSGTFNDEELIDKTNETETSDTERFQNLLKLKGEEFDSEFDKIWSERGGNADNFSVEELKALDKRIEERRNELLMDLEVEETTGEVPTGAPKESPGNTAEGAPGNAAEAAPANSPATSEERDESPNEEPKNKETISEAEAKKTAEEAKKKPDAKKVFNTAVATLLATALMGGFVVDVKNVMANENADLKDNKKATAEENVGDEEEEEEEEVKGLRDGYDEEGMWASEKKPNKLSFASAEELGEIHDNDPIEVIKSVEDAQVESYAEHVAFLPDAVKDYHGMSNWKDMTILETENELVKASKDADRYEKVQSGFNYILDEAKYRSVKLNGEYDNAFMRLKDPDGPLTHDNMEIVKCTTIENNTDALELYWEDDFGNEIGSALVKISMGEDGTIEGGCVQFVVKAGTSKAFGEMKEVKRDEKHPDQPKEEEEKEEQEEEEQEEEQEEQEEEEKEEKKEEEKEEEEEKEKEWGKSGDPHGGDDVEPSDQVDPDAEVSQEENDNTNAGNKGDAKTAPGSPSDNNNSDRLPGGDDQSDGQIAGNNTAAPAGNPEVDKQGNGNQAVAQEQAKPGGDNYSDAEEKSNVEGGNF